jgi:hypothetical protein
MPKDRRRHLRIRGAAEAEYNARVAQSLSPVLIQQQYLQKWNGQLPQYQLGGSGPLSISPRRSSYRARTHAATVVFRRSAFSLLPFRGSIAGPPESPPHGAPERAR